ncbi:hypothetical protein DF186_21050, partial [Enterococcus hirae]
QFRAISQDFSISGSAISSSFPFSGSSFKKQKIFQEFAGFNDKDFDVSGWIEQYIFFQIFIFTDDVFMEYYFQYMARSCLRMV